MENINRARCFNPAAHHFIHSIVSPAGPTRRRSVSSLVVDPPFEVRNGPAEGRKTKEQKIMERIECIASLAPVLAAIKIDGTDGNARVQFEIPASEREAILKIATLQAQCFKLIIEPERKAGDEKHIQTIVLIEDQEAESGNGDGFGLSDPG